MTPEEFLAARKILGLTAADLGRALELEGRDPGRSIRNWENGQNPIPGTVRVAVRLMLEIHARQTVQEAVQQAQAILAPPGGPPATPPAPEPPPAPKSRRRG